MANVVYAFTSISGGTDASYLDYHDGNDLTHGDLAFGAVSGFFLAYYLSSDSGAPESAPDVIAPDTNPGDKRWLLCSNISTT